MPTTLLYKDYDSDQFSEIERDVSEMFIDYFLAPDCDITPEQFQKGEIKVTVSWVGPDECRCTGFEHQRLCPHHWQNSGGDIPF